MSGGCKCRPIFVKRNLKNEAADHVAGSYVKFVFTAGHADEPLFEMDM